MVCRRKAISNAELFDGNLPLLNNVKDLTSVTSRNGQPIQGAGRYQAGCPCTEVRPRKYTCTPSTPRTHTCGRDDLLSGSRALSRHAPALEGPAAYCEPANNSGLFSRIQQHRRIWRSHFQRHRIKRHMSNSTQLNSTFSQHLHFQNPPDSPCYDKLGYCGYVISIIYKIYCRT